MNTVSFIHITILSSVLVQGRLIRKNETKSAEVNTSEHPNPAIRLTRNTKEFNKLSRLSKDYTLQNEEFISSFNNTAHHFYGMKSYTRAEASRMLPVESNSIQEISSANRYNIPNADTDTNQNVLVKKPIPKFIDAEYEDDFETRISKPRSIITDSVDVDDEDFNIHDYDFDVNHDEFISAIKSSGPRRNYNAKISSLTPDEQVFPKDRISAPPKIYTRSSKLEKVVGVLKTVEKSREYDYYDDTTKSSAKISNKEIKESDEYSDDNDNDNKQKYHKTQNRAIRSRNLISRPMNKLGEKSISTPKHLIVLPLFPQVI